MKKKDTISIIIGAIFIIVLIRAMFTCIFKSATADNYFLINTGKYILENKQIPTTNIWTMHEDFKIVIQQWLCCIENYTVYKLFGGIIGLIPMTTLHLIIFNIVIYKFIRLYTDNKNTTILMVCLANYIINSFINARPSLVTMSILTFELVQLELWNRSGRTRKDNIKLLISLALISLFQINYHSALWLTVILFELPYMVPAIWEIDIHNLKKSLLTDDIKILLQSLITIITCAMINPNGINAIRYLGNAKGIFNISGLKELQPYQINSLEAIVIIIFIVLLVIYIAKGGRDKVLIYLASGTIILSIMQKRNYWMIIFAFIKLLIVYARKIKLSNEDKIIITKNKILALTIPCTLIISLWAMILVNHSIRAIQQNYINICDNTCTVDVAVQYLDSLSEDERDNLVIYNEFNSGAYLEFKGYKAYIDARPELYMKSINGKEDIYEEWDNLRSGLLDIPKFINKYGFNTFITESDGVLDYFLDYNDNYERVAIGNGYTVYRQLQGVSD